MASERALYAALCLYGAGFMVTSSLRAVQHLNLVHVACRPRSQLLNLRLETHTNVCTACVPLLLTFQTDAARAGLTDVTCVRNCACGESTLHGKWDRRESQLDQHAVSVSQVCTLPWPYFYTLRHCRSLPGKQVGRAYGVPAEQHQPSIKSVILEVD